MNIFQQWLAENTTDDNKSRPHHPDAGLDPEDKKRLRDRDTERSDLLVDQVGQTMGILNALSAPKPHPSAEDRASGRLIVEEASLPEALSADQRTPPMAVLPGDRAR